MNDFLRPIALSAPGTSYSEACTVPDGTHGLGVRIDVSAISAGASLVATVQFSDNNVNWEDRLALTAVTAAGTVSATAPNAKAYARIKYVLTGTDATASGKLSAFPRMFELFDANGNRVDMAALVAALNSVAVESAGADGSSNTNNAFSVKARLVGFNGTTWDRIRTGFTSVVSSFLGFLNTIPYGVYRAIRQTRTDGQGGPIETGPTGEVLMTDVNLQYGNDPVTRRQLTAVSGTPFQISTATTTTVRTGSGVLNNLVCVGGTLGNVTVYDNTAASGTVLCPTVTPVANGLLLAGVSFNTGLTIVTASATVLTGSYNS